MCFNDGYLLDGIREDHQGNRWNHVGPIWVPYLAAGMACLSIRQGPGGKVKGGSPCNGMSESDIAKGGVASNCHV